MFNLIPRTRAFRSACAKSRLRRESSANVLRRALRTESLESRRCLTASMNLTASVLTITGDRGDDVVDISTRSDGDIVVTANNGRTIRTFNGADVTSIQANLGSGSNRLNIDLSRSEDDGSTVDGFNENPTINVVTGSGADRVTINLGDDGSDGGGGEGDDNGRGTVEISLNLGA